MVLKYLPSFPPHLAPLTQRDSQPPVSSPPNPPYIYCQVLMSPYYMPDTMLSPGNSTWNAAGTSPGSNSLLRGQATARREELQSVSTASAVVSKDTCHQEPLPGRPKLGQQVTKGTASLKGSLLSHSSPGRASKEGGRGHMGTSWFSRSNP